MQRILTSRVVVEVSAYQPAIPGPGVPAVCRCMHPYITAARPDVPFKIGLLTFVQHLMRGAHKNYSGIMFQDVFCEPGSIRGRIHFKPVGCSQLLNGRDRSEEHTSELQSLMRISYAVFCLPKKH